MSTTTQSEAAYTASERLDDQAASAAMYVTRDTSSTQSSHPILDENGRLSTAGAATSLKYARAQDLPSFPSQGGVKLASAGAAASLAQSSQKSFEHWKPGALPAANKAALLAKDYEMEPVWQPEVSKAGSKAASMAHKDPPDVNVWKAPESKHGLSAAGQAVGTKAPGPITQRNVPADDRQKALMAATGAMSGSRRRAESAPIKPPPTHSGWAVKAATSSQKSRPLSPQADFSPGDPGFEASRLQNMDKNRVSRQMYGSTPPVAIELEEKNRQATLRASAIAMAQKMYSIQQSHIDEAKGIKRTESKMGAVGASRNRAASDLTLSQGAAAKVLPKYDNLEEAAKKLAQERLAKLHDEHAEYRQYYYGQQKAPPKSRLSLRTRRRASSVGETSDSDEEQSRRIRSQMSLFQSKLAEVDSKKRQSDRDLVLQAAHKNVTAKMNAMDEKVFQDTGKASTHQRALWERQARERAQRDSDERMINTGKIHVGGGKYLEQSEIEAIARARLQPTLDDITEKAEAQRAKDEALRLEQEKKKAEAEKEKIRQAEVKSQARAARDKEKAEEKQRKAEEKRVQQEETTAAREKRAAEAAVEKEKRQADKEEKRKSQGTKGGVFSGFLGKSAAGTATGALAAGGTVEGATATTTGEAEDPAGERASSNSSWSEGSESGGDEPGSEQGRVDQTEDVESKDEQKDAAVGSTDATAPATPPEASAPVTARPGAELPSPTKSDSKVKSWFKTRFRTGSKSQGDVDDKPIVPETTGNATAVKDGSDDDLQRSDSMRDVALAGKGTNQETDDLYGAPSENGDVSPVKDTPGFSAANRSPSISSLSSNEAAPVSPAPPASEVESEQRGRRGFRQRLLGKVKSNKDNKDIKPKEPEPKPLEKTNTGDDADEERDTFEEEKLAPPPKSVNVNAASPRGSHERSKFTEDL